MVVMPFCKRRVPIVPLLLLCAAGLPMAGQKAAPPAKRAAAATAPPAIDKPALEAYMRHLFLWGPDVKIQVGDPRPSAVPGLREVVVRGTAQGGSAEQIFLLSDDGKKIIQGNVYDLGDNPFRQELSKLKTEFQPSLGTPGAPVVLVLFTDFQCPYCREEAKVLRQNLLNSYPKDVRLYFKDYPLEQIHPWAKAAAMAGRCVFQQNAPVFWDYHDWVFEQQASITADNFRARLIEFSKGKEIDALRLGRCLDTKATEAEVNKSIAEARSLQLNQTPYLFVNGRRLPGQTAWPQLSAIINKEIEYQKTAKNAGEQACCEVKLSAPIAK